MKDREVPTGKKCPEARKFDEGLTVGEGRRDRV
jgi:hypothetical protein